MGFDASLVFLPRLGIRVANVHYTIRGSYLVQKRGSSLLAMPQGAPNPQTSTSPFTIVFRVQVFGSSDYASLSPVHEDMVTIACADLPPSIPAACYGALKAQVLRDSPECTFVDN